MAYYSRGYRRLKDFPKNAGFNRRFVENQVGTRNLLVLKDAHIEHRRTNVGIQVLTRIDRIDKLQSRPFRL